MKNTFGSSVSVTLFGESHGPEIGAVIDGLAPGLPVDESFIASRLALRRPAGRISTARQEADAFRIVMLCVHLSSLRPSIYSSASSYCLASAVAKYQAFIILI